MGERKFRRERDRETNEVDTTGILKESEEEGKEKDKKKGREGRKERRDG